SIGLATGVCLLRMLCLMAVLLARSEAAVEIVDPATYTLGPGDQFKVSFFDAQIDPLVFDVSIEGIATAPNVGAFFLDGITLEDAKATLRKGIEEKFSGTEFDIALSRVRVKRVSVAGAVAKPGLYSIKATALSSELISLAGGLAPGSSRRNISLKLDGDHVVVDLERFERMGDFEANPPIYLGDVLIVPVLRDSTTRLFVSGEVRRPGWFEYTGRDKILDLIKLAGGLSASARTDSVLVLSGVNGDEGTLHKVESELFPGPQARLVALPKQPCADAEDISVSGEAIFTGRYPYEDGMTLVDALALSGGLKDAAYAPGITVFNTRVDRTERSRMLESLDAGSLSAAEIVNPVGPAGSPHVRIRETFDFKQGKTLSLRLAPGDSIYVPRAEGLVTVIGQVSRPGLVEFLDGLRVSELISRAGGTTDWADLSRSYVIRRVGDGATTLSSAGRIYDGDVIFVARKANKRSGFLSHVRDVALIGAGVALTALAIDELSQ
ncbi:MAG: SLBB domain-containing protein, partial [Candidatus Zixiibacteriota bacterium]